MLDELLIEIYSRTNTKTIHQLSILSRHHAGLIFEIMNKYLSNRYQNFSLTELIHAGYFNEAYLDKDGNLYYGKLREIKRTGTNNKYYLRSEYADKIIYHKQYMCMLDNNYLIDGERLINNKRYLGFEFYGPACAFGITTEGEVYNLNTLQKVQDFTNIVHTNLYDMIVIDRFGYKHKLIF